MKGFVIALVLAVLAIVLAVWITGSSRDQREVVVGLWKAEPMVGSKIFGPAYLEITPNSINGEEVAFAQKGAILQVRKPGSNTVEMRLSVNNDDKLMWRGDLLGTVPVEQRYVRATPAEQTEWQSARRAFTDFSRAAVQGAEETAEDVKDAAKEVTGKAAEAIENVAKDVKEAVKDDGKKE